MTTTTPPSPGAQHAAIGLYQVPDTPPEADPGMAYLSPDALMAYCQSRLSAIDGQIGSVMASQQSTIADVNDINSALATLQKYSSGTTDGAACQEMATALHTAIENIDGRDPNCSVLPRLKQAYNDLVWTGAGPAGSGYYPGYDPHPSPGGTEGDHDISAPEMSAFVGTLNGASADLNSGAELQLVNIQSLMSQRDTTVQLTTNLVQSLGDEQNKIANNVGH